MRNRVISYNFRGFGMFLKVPVIIIIRVIENNVLGLIYIDIYKFRGWTGVAHPAFPPIVLRYNWMKSVIRRGLTIVTILIFT